MKKEESNVKTVEKEESKDKENKIQGKTFGDRIVEGRIKNGLSQEAFAEKMGVSRQMVSRWELNTAMPRTQKIKKISEILDIPIDELLDRKLGEDFFSPQVAKRINFKAVMKCIAVILIILFVLYFAYVGYKLIILNGISTKLEQYKSVNNYHFKMESLIDGVLQETREVWYKDGYYKIIETSNLNSLESSTITYLDLNNKYKYIVNEQEKSYSQVNLYRTEKYDNGIFMYTYFPDMVKKQSTNFKEWAFKFNIIFVYYKNNSIFLTINNERIELNRENYLPINQFINMKENKNAQYNRNIYNIELNIVNDNDVTVPIGYKKLN